MKATKTIKIMKITKTIKIAWKDYFGEDEFYVGYYYCPKCKKDKIEGNIIFRDFIYCPTCGCKIKWAKDAK